MADRPKSEEESPINEHELADGGIVEKEEAQAGKDVSFERSLGVLTVRVLLNVDTKKATLDVYVALPIKGRIKLGSVHGSAIDGITVTFNAGFAKGSVRLYISGRFLRVGVKATIRGHQIDKDIRLFAVPGPKVNPGDDFAPVLANSVFVK